jgi:tetratricopeptide (TPR) repeat protein
MGATRVALCAIVAVAVVWAQRHKVSIDPETKEGYVLQCIQQERDPAQKIKLMRGFVAEFPKSESLSWVLDQLQPVHMEAKEFEQAVTMGNRMLELDPDDLDAAHNNLLAAEALKNPELIKRYAVTCWQIAGRLEKVPGYKKAEYARQMLAYAEYSIAAVANGEADQNRRNEHLKVLQQINPKSKWLEVPRSEFATLSEKGVGKDKLVAAAEKSLVVEPNNEDMLMMVADYHMQRGDNPGKVLEYSTRVVEILRTKQQPSDVAAADWDEKKQRYLGVANYMIGVISSIQGRYQQADRSLRAALPIIRGTSDQVLGAALYHLGYANYQLAEQGERQRVFDAIKFNEQCATTRSTYREQAIKNVDSIKAAYNLK